MFRIVARIVPFLLFSLFFLATTSAKAETKDKDPKIPPPRRMGKLQKLIRPKYDPGKARRVVITGSELVAFRWNYFGLSHTFTLDATLKNLWGSNHFLLDSYLSMGVQHFFASQNAFRFYVGFQPVSILDFQFRAGIFHSYAAFNYILRSENYSEYRVADLQAQRDAGDKLEIKMGLSMRLRVRLKLKFWRIILLNSFALQFYSMFGFNDQTYNTPRNYYFEPISNKILHVNDFAIFNDSYLFFEVLRYAKGDRRKLWLGLYNEYINAVNFQKDGAGPVGDPTNKLGLIGVYTALKHPAMPTIVLQFKLWLLDRYQGIIKTEGAPPDDGRGVPQFEFVAALSWDFNIFETEQRKVDAGLFNR